MIFFQTANQKLCPEIEVTLWDSPDIYSSRNCRDDFLTFKGETMTALRKHCGPGSDEKVEASYRLDKKAFVMLKAKKGKGKGFRANVCARCEPVQ